MNKKQHLVFSVQTTQGNVESIIFFKDNKYILLAADFNIDINILLKNSFTLTVWTKEILHYTRIFSKTRKVCLSNESWCDVYETAKHYLNEQWSRFMNIFGQIFN